ncbi:MAG: DUF3341 domain-containing protein [Planctomycetes bacterium]|nr:DUF3341 domain-containing protein [Planctomycetota bacterium]
MNHDRPSVPETPQVVAGLLAEFDRPETLVAAAARVKAAGYRTWDCHSPFPVHGIDPAMGIRPTILPWLVVGAGTAGVLVALVMQWWTNAVDYPLNISGKPLFSLPANIPVTFELLILFSALTAFLGALALNGLPFFSNPIFSNPRFRRVTNDRFFVSISAADPAFGEEATRAFLQSLDGVAVVEPFHRPAAPPKIPAAFHIAGALAVCMACFPPLLIAYARATKSAKPRIHVWPDMDSQAKYQTQTAHPLFPDRRSMRAGVPGTVAVGRLNADERLYEGKDGEQWVTSVPVEIDAERMRRGKERYEIYCAPCHGLSGEGDGIMAQRALEREEPWVRRSLVDDYAVKLPVGSIFNTIRHGKNTMLPYGAQVPPADRWAIVLYVKALQRAQNATIDDVPEELRDKLQ